jgi:flagellar assembly protein FliH
MAGVLSTSGQTLREADLPAGTLKRVSWAAPLEAAALGDLPMQPLTAPAPQPVVPEAPPPPLMTPPGAGFEVLPSQPAPPPANPRLEAAITELRLRGERLAEQARSDALELGLLVAKKILEQEVSTNLEALFALIKSAIRRVGESRTTVVRVCPHDLERLRGAADTTFTLGRIELKADEALGPGDVMVDGEHSTVDGTLSTRLDEIVRSLEGDEG